MPGAPNRMRYSDREVLDLMTAQILFFLCWISGNNKPNIQISSHNGNVQLGT